MQEVDVSVSPQAVEMGLLALVATMPERDHCFPWHPCSVLEPSKENVLGRASGRCWGCSYSPCAASDICNLFELVLHWLPSLRELFLSGLSAQWQSKTGEGRNVPSPRGDRARVFNHMKLTDSLLAEKGGTLILPSSRGKDVAVPPFLTRGRRGRSGPGQRAPASSASSCSSFSSSSSAPRHLELSLPSVLGISCMGLSTALPVIPRAASALGSSDALAQGVSV